MSTGDLTKPGVHHGMLAGAYHSDPVIGGSLRASVAATLIEKSPRHALHKDSEPLPTPSREMNIGTAAHSLILEKQDMVEVIDAADFKTKSAREARDDALAAGKVPLLAGDYPLVAEIAREFWLQLPAAMHDEFRDAAKEAVVIWDEAGLTCRSRLDALNIDRRVIFDLKTTGGSAHPEVWSRSRMWPGAAVQAAFYTRGVKAVTGVDCDYRLLVIEQDPPHGLSVIGLDTIAAAVADQMADVAIRTWRECRASGRWPAYDTGIHWASAPPWTVKSWEEGKEAAKLLRQASVPLGALHLAMAAQRPLEWG
ncbi:MAG: PD-(D/E)XK nuclease-like domain-containing protein [Gemmataceae bacterium]